MKYTLPICARLFVVGVLGLLALAGCSSSAPTLGGTTGASAKPTPTPTSTPSPTPTPTPAAVALGTNLIVNGNAEQSACPTSTDTVVPTIPGWTKTGNVTTIQYGASGGDLDSSSPGPSDRGNCYFWGGPNLTDNSNGTLTQTIDVGSLAQMIDSASLTYQLSAWLGGFSSQDDHATLSIQFLNASAAVVGTASVGPVLAKDRQDTSELVQKTGSGAVPAGTRSVKVTLTITKADASDNDGLADDLSLSLQQG